MKSLSEIWKQQVHRMFSNQEDSLNEQDSLLDNLDETYTSFCRTPLHIAVMSGDVEYATKILSVKPDLAFEQDSNGFTPLHLASVRTSLPMVRLLVGAKPGACTVQNGDGRTPLHLAAIENRVEIIRVLMEEGLPEAIHLKNEKNGETILHLCVKSNSSLETLKLLAGYLVPAQPPYPDSVSINSTDNDGNTILHLALEIGNMKVTNYLLLDSNVRIDLNVVNTKGVRALNMLPKADKSNLEYGFYDYHARHEKCRKKTVPKNGNEHEGLKDRVNALMVVATLIAGIAFQAAMNPPGGVWQEDSKVNSGDDPIIFAGYLDSMYGRSFFSDTFSRYINIQYIFRAEPAIGEFVSALKDIRRTNVFKRISTDLIFDETQFADIISNYNKSGNNSNGVFFPYIIRYAGYPILAYTYPDGYLIYTVTNGIAFFVSLAIIFLVVCGFMNETSVTQVRILVVLMCISIGCIACGYLSTAHIMVPPFDSGAVDVYMMLSIFLVFYCILGVGYFIWNLTWKIVKLRKRTRHHHIGIINYAIALISGLDAKDAGKLTLFIVACGAFRLVGSGYRGGYWSHIYNYFIYPMFH